MMSATELGIQNSKFFTQTKTPSKSKHHNDSESMPWSFSGASPIAMHFSLTATPGPPWMVTSPKGTIVGKRFGPESRFCAGLSGSQLLVTCSIL